MARGLQPARPPQRVGASSSRPYALAFCALLHALTRCSPADAQSCIITVAGGNGPGFASRPLPPGDGIPATAARLRDPSSVTPHASGYLITDSNNHAIRFVNRSSGVISVLAGQPGVQAYTGDGSPATSATLSIPCAVVAYAGGWLIADSGNSAVRFVNGSSGTIMTIAGGRGYGCEGDGRPAQTARLTGPNALAVNGSDVFVSDFSCNRIFRIAANGIITTVAGTGQRTYTAMDGVATLVDIGWLRSLAIYGRSLIMSDNDCNVIRRLDANGNLTTIAGGNASAPNTCMGPATSCSLFLPQSIAADSSGYVIADRSNAIIRRVNASGILSYITVPAFLVDAVAIDLNGSLLYISANSLFRLNADNSSTLLAGGNGAGYVPLQPADGNAAFLNTPTSVSLDALGSYLIADSSNHIIRRVNSSGAMAVVAGTPTANGYGGDGGPATSALLSGPLATAFYTPAGASNRGFIIADTINSALRLVTDVGRISTICGTRSGAGYSGDGGPATNAQLNYPAAVAVNGSEIFVADTDSLCVRFINANGIITTIAGSCGGTQGSYGQGQPAVNALLGTVYGLAIVADGLLITDVDNAVVYRVDRNGIIWYASALTLESPFSAPSTPYGVAPVEGRSFLALFTYSTSTRILFVDPENSVSITVAQSSAFGYAGDGGSTSSAVFNEPRGLAADGTRGFFIADTQNHAVRYVTPPGMCQPTVDCDVARPFVNCTFSQVAPYFQLNASLAGVPCILQHLPPTSVRTVLCALPTTTSGMLTWTAGGSAGNITVAFPSPSTTPSVTASSTVTSSTTATATWSSSQSPSATCSGSATVTASSFQGASASSTLSTGASASLSSSVGAQAGSASSSPLQMASSTETVSAVSTVSTSATMSAGFSSSGSIIATASAAASGSSAASTGSFSGTASSTSGRSTVAASPSASVATMFPSSTLTSSPIVAAQGAPALALFFTSAEPSRITPLAQLMLRDVDAPVIVRVRASTCRGCTLTIVSTSPFVRAWPTVMSVSEDNDVFVSVWAPYRATTDAAAGQLSFSLLRPADSATAVARVPALVSPLVLPLIMDVLVHSKFDASSQLFRSVWQQGACNVTSVLGPSQQDVSAALFSPHSSISTALDVALLTYCTRMSPAPMPTYALTCNGGSNLTLVTATLFNSSTRIRIGGLPPVSVRISLDMRMLHVQLPSSFALCGAYECGYVPLALDAGRLTLTCPGLCTDSTRLTPQCSATNCVAASVSDVSSPPLMMSTTRTSGLFITSVCSLDVYTDPSTGACSNASDPAAARCAFGAGDSCRPCPSNSLCPGGFRAWPLPGFYSPSESSALVTACPAPMRRCAGWDAAESTVSCASGYKAYSFMCLACAAGSYASIDSSCVACPSTPSPTEAIIPFTIFVGYFLAVLLLVYVVMITIALLVKSRTSDIHSRMGALVAWSFVTVQLVAQAGRAAASGLPPALLAMYAALAVSQFSSITLPSSCIAGYPYTGEVSSMVVGLGAFMCAAGLTAYVSRASFSHVHARALHTCATILTLVYPTLVNAALSLVSCTSVRVSPFAYTTLDGDGSSLTRAGIILSATSSSALIDVSVRSSNPSQVCYEGPHFAAAALAWAALAVVGVIYPAVCMWCVHLRMRKDVLAAQRARARAPSFRRGRTHSILYADPGMDGLSAGASQAHAKPPHTLSFSGIRLASSQSVSAKDQAAESPAISCCTCCTQTRLADDCDRVIHDALLAPFVHGDYRPAAFGFYAVDRYVMLSLAVIAATLRNTTDVTTIAVRLSLLVLSLVVNAALIVAYSPYAAKDWWKRAVKLLTIGLTCAIALLNAMTNVITLQAGPDGVMAGSSGSAAISSGAYIVFGLCICVLVALLLTFMINAITPPPRIVVHTDAEVAEQARQVRDDARANVVPVAGQLSSDDAVTQHLNPLTDSAVHVPAEQVVARLEPLANALAFSASGRASSTHAKRVARQSTALRTDEDGISSVNGSFAARAAGQTQTIRHMFPSQQAYGGQRRRRR